MVKFKTLLLIIVSIITFCSRSFYKAEVEWNIFVENNNSYEISIIVLSDTSVSIGSYEHERLDLLNVNQTKIKANESSILKVRYLHRNGYSDEEPHVDIPELFKCIMQIDSAQSTIMAAEIDLFPFPKLQDYQLCS